MQFNQNGYIEPERLPTQVPQEASAEATQETAAQAPPQVTPQQQAKPSQLEGLSKFFEENIAIPLIDQLDQSRNAEQVAGDRADARQGIAQFEEDLGPTVLSETGTAVIGGVGDVVETGVNTLNLAGDAIGSVADAAGIIDRDSSDILWSESYEWADFDLGLAENQTIAGNVGRSIISSVVGMAALGGAGIGVGAGKTIGSRLASEALRGGLYDFFSSADGGNLSNLVQLGPLANPLSKAIAHQDEDNVWIRRIKNTLEGGTIGLAVDGLMELYGALRAGKAAVKAGKSPEQATQVAIETVALYHGTSKAGAEGIRTQGFRTSNNQVMPGKGVYFAEDPRYASAYAFDDGLDYANVDGSVIGGLDNLPEVTGEVLQGRLPEGTRILDIPSTGLSLTEFGKKKGFKNRTELVRWVKEQGYDGIRYDPDINAKPGEGGALEYFVFDPKVADQVVAPKSDIDTSPGKIENDAASGRPGTPEEGGKPPLLDPQDRVFQGRKDKDVNNAAASFWDDVEPGGGNSVVDELDVQSLQSLDQVKDFISTRIPDVDVEDIARRLRRQPDEYVEKVFRSLADFAGSRNYEALEDLRFANTFDVKGVDAGGAVVLDTLTKSLGDRVSILAKEVMELTELDAPFKVQANQILDRAQAMVLLRKESTQFASQNLQNWKDVPNDLKRAVENDRSKINLLFDELRTDLNSSDTMNIQRAKERFAKLGIALASAKGDPVAQMNFWEGLGRAGWAQFENVYINSMLSSPLSHMRNIGGNAIAVAERSSSRVLGNAITGNFAEAKRGLAAYDAFGSTLREAFKVGRESWSSPYSRVSAGAKVTDRVAARRRELEAIVNSAQTQNQKMAGQIALRAFNLFNNPWFSWPGKGLQAGDDFFKTILARTELRYQAAVESDALADGASAIDRKALREKNYQILVQDKLSANGEILDHDLIKVSEEATFQRDLEGWAAGMSTGLRAMPGGRIIVPFLKTGHNINRYAKELTPLQLLSKEYGQTMKYGTPDEKAIMNGRIALGSSVMGTAAFMAGADLITGVGPLPGPQRDLWLKDHEPMSIKVGGKWVSYQAIPGFSLLISTTADVTQMTQKMRDGDVDYVLGALPFFFTNAISTQPMFQGILDMSEVLDFGNYTPEKAGEAIASIANRMGGGEGLRRHMENAISKNMYDYKNWAVAFIGKVTGGIAPSAYDLIMGEDIAKVPRIDVLTGKPMVSKYSNPANSINPFTVIGKEVSPLVETFQSLGFPINLVVPDKVAGVKLTPDQKNFVAKEVYNDGEMSKRFATTFKSKYFWNKYEQWRQDMAKGTALPKEQSDWYRILTKIQQQYKSRAVKELKTGDSEWSKQFREEYAAKSTEGSNAPGVSAADQSRLRDIQDLANF